MSELVSVTSALMLMHSFFYNPRRTEDLTHPLWNRLVNQWCEQVSRSVLPTPQLKLYTSPLDKDTSATNPDESDDADLDFIERFRASTRTLADPKARGVVTDFSALMPLISSSASPGVNLDVAKLQRLLEHHKNLGTTLQNLSLSMVFALALIELKRPVSRTIIGLPKFIRSLCVSMVNAQNQVEKQAACLFGSPKYAYQRSVIVVAAVGEWWTTQVINRGGLDDEFTLEKYEILLDKEDDDEKKAKKDKTMQGDILLEREDENDLIVSLTEVNSKLGSVEAKVSKLEAERREMVEAMKKTTEDMKTDRWKRAAQRNTRREEAEKEQRLTELWYQFDPQLATDDTLREFSELLTWAKSSGAAIPENDVGANFHAASIPEGSITRESLGEWTGLLKVGSNVSNKYMEFIKREFNEAVKNKGY